MFKGPHEYLILITQGTLQKQQLPAESRPLLIIYEVVYLKRDLTTRIMDTVYPMMTNSLRIKGVLCSFQTWRILQALDLKRLVP